jgi:hypothetical protein
MLNAALPADAPALVVDFYRGTFSWHLDRPHAYLFGAEAAAEAIAGTSRPLGLLVDSGIAEDAPDWLNDAEGLGEHAIESRIVHVYVLPEGR